MLGLKNCIFGFLSLLLSSAPVLAAEHAKSVLIRNAARNEPLAGHVYLLQDLKNYFKNKNPRPALTPSQQNITHTPTQAYLSIPSLKSNLESNWGDKLKKFKPIIDAVIEREKEFNATHYVFYHGQQGAFRILEDFIKEWYSLLHITEELNEFDFLRMWYEGVAKADALGLVEKYHGQIDNYSDGLDKILLSVNLSLFGNINNSTSCTFRYFADNFSMQPPSIQAIIEQILKKYKLDTSYASRLLNIAIGYNKANLLQIFIPKEVVDRCVYLAIVGGPVYNSLIAPEVYDSHNCWHTAISPILDLYQTAPEKIPAHILDSFQARIILSQDVMLNPNSGVKIFRYDTINASRKRVYKKNLRELVREMFVDSIKHNGIDPETAVGRLMRSFRAIEAA